jgi:alpha-beta hydrolase superfamily lysophospholipase
VRALAAVLPHALLACGDDDPALPGQVVEREVVGDLQRIRYGSIGVSGEPSEVTGLLAVPAGDAPAGGWPIVAYAHPTTGGADGCAPSADPSLGGVGDLLAALAAAGYVAVATDYEGLGTPGPHPYLHGPSAARAVVDSVRAARQVVRRAGTRWAAVGHSQGGHAVLFAGSLAGDLAPELDLVGVVAVAPVLEVPDFVLRESELGRTPLALALAGWLAVDADADEVLTDAGRDAVDAVEASCDFVGGGQRSFVQPEAEAGFEAFLAAQSPPAAATPVLVVQGGRDTITPPSSARIDDLCAGGGPTEVRTVARADHVGVLDRAWVDVPAWLAARVAGEPPADMC